MLPPQQFINYLGTRKNSDDSNEIKLKLQEMYKKTVNQLVSKKTEYLWEAIGLCQDLFEDLEDYSGNFPIDFSFRIELLETEYRRLYTLKNSSLYALYSEYEQIFYGFKRKSIKKEEAFLFYLYSRINKKELRKKCLLKEDYLWLGQLTAYLFCYRRGNLNSHQFKAFVFDYYNQYFINYNLESFYLELYTISEC